MKKINFAFGLTLVALALGLGACNLEVPGGYIAPGTDTTVVSDTRADGVGVGTDAYLTPVDTGTPKACLLDNDCDDGVACTIDLCTAGTCAYGVTPGRCFIGFVCYEPGALATGEGCNICNPAVSQVDWTTSPTCDIDAHGSDAVSTDADGGTDVADDDVLSQEDSGPDSGGTEVEVSQPPPKCLIAECDDGNVCTQDGCNEANNSCVHLAKEGTCDDGNPCTTDACVYGACANTPITCDDGDPCSGDSCDPATGGCIHIPGIDTDGDKVADCVDPDDDGDGKLDLADNCPLVANADQTDTDKDGQGDACDPTLSCVGVGANPEYLPAGLVNYAGCTGACVVAKVAVCVYLANPDDGNCTYDNDSDGVPDLVDCNDQNNGVKQCGLPPLCAGTWTVTPP